jgi:hypothetical protein
MEVTVDEEWFMKRIPRVVLDEFVRTLRKHVANTAKLLQDSQLLERN